MEAITTIILAGGQSSRMGQDKGLVDYNGKPMIQWMIEAAKPISKAIIIVANNSAYKKFGFQVIPDRIQLKGPLAGLIEGLTATQTSKNIILPCDVPNIQTALLIELINELQDYDGVITVNHAQKHPLIAAFHQSALIPLKEQLALDNLKLLDALKVLNLKEYNADGYDSTQFQNINTPADLCS
jgi:molybdopterin-guanine dinucleotide biosynthesis protein A